MMTAFGLALLCAALMGFANQRGAICMVAAVEQLLAERRASRMIAMAEAGVWVAAGILAAGALGIGSIRPPVSPVGWNTMVGGALLGMGALVNRACAFGTIARLGSGQWAYAATPVGFFGGCWIVASWQADLARSAGQTAALVLGPVGVMALAAFVLWRSSATWVALRRGRWEWTAYEATMVIGLTSAGLMLTVGNWTYTQALTDAVHGMTHDLSARLILFGCVLAGAIGGGWTIGALRLVMPTLSALTRCLTGGILMGLGSGLIPGSNDKLILIGLPFLLPYAWVALAGMILTIVIGMRIERKFLSAG